MVDAKLPFRAIPTAAVLAALLVASGCVRSSTFRAEVDQLREEIRTGDAQVEQRLSSRIDGVEGRMLALEHELMALEEEFGARVERMEEALRVHAPIHFGFDEAHVEPDQAQVLERLGAVLREYYPQALITVEGFTDSAGSPAYNLQLGQRRAEAVREHLLLLGMSGSQVRAVSYGEDVSRQVRPGVSGPGTAGRENRRVVIVIDHPTAWGAAATVSQLDSEG